MCKELLIPPGTQNYVVRMRLYDLDKHLLCLTIRIILRAPGALKVLISAPYWLVNKTGTSPFYFMHKYTHAVNTDVRRADVLVVLFQGCH